MRLPNFFYNRFLQASSVVFAGSIMANFLNYVFNLVLGRMLSPVVYGELVSLVTLLVIVGVPGSTATIVLAKFSSAGLAQGDSRVGLTRLLRSATGLALIVGGVGLVVLLALAPFLASYLKISTLPVLLFCLLWPLSFLNATSSGFLQGLQRFVPLSIMSVIGAGLKLLLSIVLVLLGFSLGGIMAALVVASLITYLYGLWHIQKSKQVESLKPSSVPWAKVFSGSFGFLGLAFVATLALSVFLNIDLLLSKHYLLQEAAGQYAALSVLGKIITYGSTAVLTVFFPMASASHTSGDGRTGRLLGFSLSLVGGASVALFLLFWLFPVPILHILFGSRYLAAAPLLVYFAGAMCLSALATVFIQYFLATSRSAFLWPLIILTIAEAGGIILYHNSILQIVLSSLITSALCLVSMVIVYAAQRPLKPRVTAAEF